MKQVVLPLLREKRCDVVALRSCRRDVTHQTSTKWWNRDYVVDIEVHVFFLIKAFGRNIELRVKLSYVFYIVPYGILHNY